MTKSLVGVYVNPMRVRLYTVSLLSLAAFLWPLQALSAEEASSGGSQRPDLGVSRGARSLPPALDSKEAPDLGEPVEAKEGGVASKDHTKSRRPRTPRARMPKGSPLSQPSDKARRSIAEGATAEELRLGAEDKELSALKRAEKVLFPRRVRGLHANWSFDLPDDEIESSRTLGLPLNVSVDEAGAPMSKEDITWLRTLTMPDLPVRLDQRVVTYLKFYRDSHRGRTIAAIWTRKSGRYVAEMKAKLRRAGLPTDLVWLSMIESGHNPTIRSPAGAMGLWQFMPASGRMYGLTVDRWVDERRDPARSTQASIRFLSDLYRRFGNWELAMGAYNMGYAGMSRAVAKYNTNDYWALSRMESGIPWETTLYVPKIFALAIVMNNREAFGVGRTKLDAPVVFDTILLEPATTLKEVAKAAGISVDSLSRLNPQYLAQRLPPQVSGPVVKWPVRLPVGRGEQTLAALKKKASPQKLAYRVLLGDSVQGIAQRYGVSRRSLLSENAISSKERLEPGTILLLPRGAKLAKKSARADVVVSRVLNPAEGQRRVFYQVQSGDLLSEIARSFGVMESDLARWNVLNTRAHLRSGMTLQILVDQKSQLKNVRYVSADDARVLLAGSPEFHEHFEGIKGKRRVQITVASGDTLRKLGARYGMSVGSMERVNRRSRKTKLIVGEKLIVYTERRVTAAKEDSSKRELPALVAPRPNVLP